MTQLVDNPTKLIDDLCKNHIKVIVISGEVTLAEMKEYTHLTVRNIYVYPPMSSQQKCGAPLHSQDKSVDLSYIAKVKAKNKKGSLIEIFCKANHEGTISWSTKV